MPPSRGAGPGKDLKKDFLRKLGGFLLFLVQMGLETKQNEKTRSLPQISEDMISRQNMVSPGADRLSPPPPRATPLHLPLRQRLPYYKTEFIAVAVFFSIWLVL